jgi:anti-sigma B factor antagonist
VVIHGRRQGRNWIVADLGSIREYPLVVGIDREEDALVVRAAGELDLATAALLEEALWQAFEQHEATLIVVDLTAVRFIDAAGLRLLTWAAAGSRENGHRLGIRSGAGAVRRMIETTGAERSLPLIA